MTNKTNESLPLNESIQEYVDRNEEQFTTLLESAFKQGKIDEFNYKRLMSEYCEYIEWDDVFRYYESIYLDFIETLIHNRLLKGAELIEQESDPEKKAYYLRIYDGLVEKLETLKGA